MSIKPGDIVLVQVREDNSKSRASVTELNGKLSTVKLEESGDIHEVLTDSMELAPMRIDFVDTAPTPLIQKTMDTLKDVKGDLIQSSRVPKDRQGQEKRRPRSKWKKNSNSDTGQPSSDQLQRLMEKFNGE